MVVAERRVVAGRVLLKKVVERRLVAGKEAASPLLYFLSYLNY